MLLNVTLIGEYCTLFRVEDIEKLIDQLYYRCTAEEENDLDL